MPNKPHNVFTALLMVFALVGTLPATLSHAQTMPAPAVGQAAAPMQPMAPQMPVGAETTITDLDYRLGAGDKLRVTTFGEDSLTGEFFVAANGKVAMPLIGEVDAGGQTVREFQKRVETVMRDGYLTDPHVSIEVLNYRPFYILGEVNGPGTYPYTSGLTVLNAVATAKGFTYRANTKKVFIKHANETEEKAVKVTPATPVAPGDTIRVPERFF